MRCRLCLKELTNNFISLFNDNGDIIQDDLVKNIVKYLELELMFKDDFSTQICKDCYKHLDDFDRFCLSIKEKQEILEQELANGVVIIPDSLEPQDWDQSEEEDTCAKPYSNPSNGCVESEDFDMIENIVEIDDQELEIEEEVEEEEELNDESSYDDELSEPEEEENDDTTSIDQKQKENLKICDETESQPEAEPDEDDILSDEALIKENVSLVCDICNKSLDSFSNLKIHFTKEHKTIGYIKCCKAKFKDRKLLVDHINLHKDPDYFKCQICDRTLVSRNSLNKHMSSMHSIENQQTFECSICSMKFEKEMMLNSHIKSRHRGELQCNSCDKIFKSKVSLRSHKRYAHSNVLHVVCDLCGVVLKNKTNLKYHMSAVHNIGGLHVKVQCKVCENWFVNERSLKKHMARYKQQFRILHCPICGVEKTSKSKLTVHMNYYHNDKIFKCSYCDKELKTQLSLNEHIATHTGENLYTCPYCPKTFKAHSNMYNHKKKMHAEELAAKKLKSHDY